MPGRGGELTVRGRSMLSGALAVLVCGIALDELDLVRLGVTVAALPLLALLLAAWTARAVHLTRYLDAGRLPAGAGTTVTVEIRVPLLLTTVEVTDTVPDAAGPDPLAPPQFTLRRPADRARLEYRLLPRHRGVHRIGPAHLRITDPLGLAAATREVPDAATLVALPRIEPLHGSTVLPGAGEGVVGAGGARPGPGSPDLLIRPWRHGDQLRRVHWRSTARHDEMMVRTEERPRHRGLTVLLDRRDCAHRGRGTASSLEFAVTTAASICAHLHDRGDQVTLVAEDGNRLTGTTTGTLDPLLDTLAALRPSAGTALRPPLRGEDAGVCAVLGATTPGQVRPLLDLTGTANTVILLDVGTWDPAGAAGLGTDARAVAALLRSAGWWVAVAAAGDSPAALWLRLAGTGIR